MLAAAVWIVGAIAEPLDLRALERLEQERIQAPVADRAQQQRVASMERLEALLTPSVQGEPRAEMMLRLADLHLEEGLYTREPSHHEQAVALFEEILREFPQYARSDEAWFFLGRARVELDDREGASEAFQGVVDRYPTSSYLPDALLWLADSSQDGDARKVLVERVMQSPDSAAATKAAELVPWWFGEQLPPPPVQPAQRCNALAAAAENPSEQLETVRCWLDVGNQGQAANAVGVLNREFGPSSSWPRNRTMKKHARDAVKLGHELVEGR